MDEVCIQDKHVYCLALKGFPICIHFSANFRQNNFLDHGTDQQLEKDARVRSCMFDHVGFGVTGNRNAACWSCARVRTVKRPRRCVALRREGVRVTKKEDPSLLYLVLVGPVRLGGKKCTGTYIYA